MIMKIYLCTSLLLGLHEIFIESVNVVTKEIKLSNRNAQYDTTCAAQGFSYFDSSKQNCGSCPTNQIADPNSLATDGDSVNCKCASGYYEQTISCLSNSDGGCSSFNCTSCLQFNQVAYTDQTGCVSCGSTTVGIGSDNDCSCANNYVLLETDISGNKLSNKTCAACPSGRIPVTTSQVIAGRFYPASKYICAECPDSRMSMSLVNNVYSCSCSSGYTITGVSGIGEQSCIPSTIANTYSVQVTSAAVVDYHTISVTVTNSQTFLHYFLSASTYCRYYGGTQDVLYCQQLANLCVLQLYDVSSPACAVFLEIVGYRGANVNYNITSWGKGMPWLYYSTISLGVSVCEENIYSATVAVKGNTLTYVVAKYFLNGTFDGYDNLNTLFSYCSLSAPYSGAGGGAGSSTRWQVFGTNDKSTYQCSLRSLLMQNEQRFYELFLYDSESLLFTPVTVIVSTMLASETIPASILAASPDLLCLPTDQFYRRFFLFDITSGISTVGSDPVVMRYAKFIQLAVKLIPGSANGHIYPPVLRIFYAESNVAAWPTSSDDSRTTDETVKYSFRADYFSDLTTFFNTATGVAVAALVIVIILFIIRYRNWQRRNSRVVTQAALTTDLGGANCKAIFEIILLFLHSFVLVFFPFTLLTCWYVFVFFKLQTVPAIFPPPQLLDPLSSVSPYYYFATVLYIMTFIQVFYVALVICYRQANADIFLIDWEPLKAASAVTTTQQQQQAKAQGGGQSRNTVSIWRTIMVANEYAELQTTRRTDIRFTLFFLAFFLVGLDLQYNATPQPNLNDLTAGEYNIVLRFANSTFFWLAISMAQYWWRYLIYERYFAEPPEQIFLDFCTLAKISILVLDEKYHGFYLHCRSPHQHADADMLELVSMLQKEEAGLTTDRSLEGAPVDVQTFRLFLSGEFRTEFEKISMQLNTPTSMAELVDQRRNAMQLQQQRQSLLAGRTPQSNNKSAGLFGITARPSRHGQRGGASSGGGMNGSGRGGLLSTLTGAITVPPSEKILRAWQEMQTLLTQFVENNLGASALRRIVHEPSFWEYMTDVGPDLTQPGQPSVFYPDREGHFTSAMFLGRERDLLLLNILSYSLFDLWFGSTMVSVLLAYLLDLGLKRWRYSIGTAVLSRKTLVDSRFLI